MKRITLAVCLLWFAVAALPLRAEIAIQEVTSPGGITAWLVEEHSLPFTALEIRFRGGASLEAPGKRGAINLMTGLLEEGAGALDARAFAEAREALAASFRFDAGDDSIAISAQFLSENRATAIGLLQSALNEPLFDAESIERVRAQVLSHLRSRKTDPDALAGSRFDALAFGEHPYGQYYSGSIDSVTALTRGDIQQAYRRSIVRDRIHVGVVGDITAAELGEMLDTLFAELPQTGASDAGPAGFALAGGVTIVDFDTPQSVAIFGHEGIRRDDPDFFAAFVINQIMGGGNFNSRLMDELRERRGLTYGVRSYLIPMFLGESLMGFFSSSNERMAEGVELVRAEWARMASEGITKEELRAAQTYLTGAYPLRFDGNGPIARIMVSMQMIDLPIDYIATRNDQINAVTLEDANRVAARIFRPDDLHFVIVGQPDGIESSE